MFINNKHDCILQVEAEPVDRRNRWEVSRLLVEPDVASESCDYCYYYYYYSVYKMITQRTNIVSDVFFRRHFTGKRFLSLCRYITKRKRDTINMNFVLYFHKRIMNIIAIEHFCSTPGVFQKSATKKKKYRTFHIFYSSKVIFRHFTHYLHLSLMKNDFKNVIIVLLIYYKCNLTIDK